MPQLVTRGIAIKRKNFKEADRLVTFITPANGKITARARAVRKPLSRLAGHIELFSDSRIILEEGKSWYTLTGAEIIHAHEELRSDLHLTSLAYVIAELLDTTVQEETSADEIFILLQESLHLLEKTKNDLVIWVFIWNLLGLTGFGANLFSCVVCHQKIETEPIYFSNSLGGVVHKEHADQDIEAQLVSKDCIKFLRMIARDIRFAGRIKLESACRKECMSLIRRYAEFILERQPKSLAFVRSLYENMD